MQTSEAQLLSQEAVSDFQSIYSDCFGERLSDAEASKRAGEVLALFSILRNQGSVSRKTEVNETEEKCLQYVSRLLDEGKQPTVRGMAEFLGRRSSRTGSRMFTHLIERGLLTRDQNGDVTIAARD